MADRILVDYPSMAYARYFPSLESLLQDSATRFLADSHADLNKFHYILSRVLNAYPDPPLEAVWFFSALIFHSAPDDIRSILHLLSASTASSPSPEKPLALLAPVVSALFHSTEPHKKIEALFDAVLKYIETCSSRPAGVEVDDDDDEARLLPVFEDLVKVWSVRDSSERTPFQVLFPLVGEEARRELMKKGCSVSFLAGVVLAEALLLRLYLKVQGAAGEQRSELQKQLRLLAVQSIKVSQNQQFFGVLLKMLANSPLPVYSQSCADDEILVRHVLYDLLILDYSDLSGAEVDEADSSIFLSRLVIIVDAISDARREGDQEKEILYTDAFLTSNIVCDLTRWAICRAGTDQFGKLIDISPHGFLKWLVDIEDKGIKVFGDNYSRIKGKLMNDEGKNDNQNMISESDDLFIIDEQSRQEGMDTECREDEEAMVMEIADHALMGAAHSMIVMPNDTRKRKDCATEDATVVKFMKYKAEDSSVKDYVM